MERKGVDCHERPSKKWKIGQREVNLVWNVKPRGPAAGGKLKRSQKRAQESMTGKSRSLCCDLFWFNQSTRRDKKWVFSWGEAEVHSRKKQWGRKRKPLKRSCERLWSFSDRPTNSFTAQWFTMWLMKAGNLFTSYLCQTHPKRQGFNSFMTPKWVSPQKVHWALVLSFILMWLQED